MRKSKEKKIVVSDEHKTLRIIGFVFAVIVAVVAFSKAISSIGIHEPGYYEITADADKDAMLYASDTEFKYYLDGNVNEIRQLNKLVTAEYSSAMQRAYKLLDPCTEYEGYINIASVNTSQNHELAVSDELFAVLKDAYAKTLREEGYNMFAGALYAEWKGIIHSFNASDFDPENDPEEASRIAKIAEMTADLSNFEFRLDENKKSVEFAVSDEYKKMLSDLEIDAPVLDLNLLEPAYRIDILIQSLVALGHTDFVLENDCGLVVDMKGDGLKYFMYTYSDGKVVEAKALDMDGCFCAAAFRAFPTNEELLDSYILKNKEGEEIFRHLYFNVKTGDFPGILLSSYVISADIDPVEAVYTNIVLCAAESSERIDEILASSGSSQMIKIFKGE